jgi:hypothetical protein
MLAITGAAGWLLAFVLCAVVTRLPPRWAGPTVPWPGLGGERPALVNLVVTRGRLNGAAYPATVLDLAAKGHLMITQRAPGQLWCDVPAAASADTGLARSERLALADARRLAGQGGAPFEAVAESCASDVRGKWDPFEEAVRAEGRQVGLTRPRLPAAVQAPLYVSAGIVSLLVFRAVDAVPHTSGVVAPLVAAFFAFIIPVTTVGSLGQKDRPTSHGAAVGAWAAREAADAAAGWRHLSPVPVSSPAELSVLALAVAAGAPVPVPGVSPGLAAGVRPGRATARSAQSARTPRPSVAWSSVGGQWRLVGIGPVRSGGIHPAAWLGLVALLAFLAFGTSLWPGPAGLLLPVLLAAAAAAVGVFAVRRLGAWLARPAEASFQGQVIARWIERHGNNDSDWDVSCIAVDDGERSWSFYVKDAAFAKLALGEAVAVRAAPRSGELLSLVPLRDGAAAPGQPAPDLMADEPFLRVAPGSSNLLLTEQEVSAVVGRPVEATGFQLGMLGAIYRGADLTVSLTVTRGGMGRLSYGPARQWGRALPGIGDEAWQLARDKTVVFRLGGYTGKVTLSGSAARGLAPDVPSRLAAAVAARLAGWPPWPPAGTPAPGTSSGPPASISDSPETFTQPGGIFSEPPGTPSSRRTRRPSRVRSAGPHPPSVHLLLTILP